MSHQIEIEDYQYAFEQADIRITASTGEEIPIGWYWRIGAATLWNGPYDRSRDALGAALHYLIQNARLGMIAQQITYYRERLHGKRKQELHPSRFDSYEATYTHLRQELETTDLLVSEMERNKQRGGTTENTGDEI